MQSGHRWSWLGESINTGTNIPSNERPLPESLSASAATEVPFRKRHRPFSADCYAIMYRFAFKEAVVRSRILFAAPTAEDVGVTFLRAGNPAFLFRDYLGILCRSLLIFIGGIADADKTSRAALTAASLAARK